MNALDSRAEIIKLARLLRREPDELRYLEHVPADELRLLREQVTDALFSAQGAALTRLAAASRVLPVALVATIGQHAFGPLLSARIAGLIEPSRAAEIAERMPTEFLADIAIELDPRRASKVIARIPPHRIGHITEVLVRRREYVTMGRFVGQLDEEAVSAALAVTDDSTLLHVAFVLESRDGLDELVETLGPARLHGIIAAAARENLWVEILGLLSDLSDERRQALAADAGAQSDGVLEGILRTAAEQDLWLELLPLAPALPVEGRRRVVDEISKLEPSHRARIAAQAREAGLEEELGVIEAELGSHSRQGPPVGEPQA